MKRFLLSLFLLASAVAAAAQPLLPSQWAGARVAFLGDSITDERQIPTTNNIYWNNLVDILGIRPYVYGISGHRMNQIIGQGERLEREHGQEVDAILVFIGTNDFNGNVPLGEWYSYSIEKTVDDGPEEVERKHREPVYDDATFKGRANTTLRWHKTHYPDKQIIFLTPIHRGYAKFSDKNIQPPESFANDNGYFIDDYVQAVKELANVWAVPVIDLNSVSGLYPLLDAQAPYFRNPDSDRLHPNTPGQLRMAWAIACQLLAYPAVFPKYVAVELDDSEDARPLPEDVLDTVRDGDILRVSARDEDTLKRLEELIPALERRGFTVLDSAAKLWAVRGIPAPENNDKTNVY